MILQLGVKVSERPSTGIIIQCRMLDNHAAIDHSGFAQADQGLPACMSGCCPDLQVGRREVQRILMELLNQMDGFDQTVNVKVIMATNRADTLDPALLRPGRLDRKIEFPLPDRRQKRLVFQVRTS